LEERRSYRRPRRRLAAQEIGLAAACAQIEVRALRSGLLDSEGRDPAPLHFPEIQMHQSAPMTRFVNATGKRLALRMGGSQIRYAPAGRSRWQGLG